MSNANKYVFYGLRVIAWIIFIGLCIEAGALLVNFVISIYKPEIVSRLYEKLDLSELFAYSENAYYGIYSFILAVAMLKAYLFYVVIELVSKLSLSKPFSEYVADKINKVSYFTFSIGLVSYIGKETAKHLQHRGIELNALNKFWADSEAFILMAAIIYVIANIFKRGIEIQNENDLTI
ncbi:MAG: DUF2975 domain-containing protein [Leadbetterella sp.]|jgi:hypothetical protein|nr:DUF2975 domain-containing protein [Leadbetterella sp.]